MLQLFRGLACLFLDRREATLVAFLDVDAAFLCCHIFTE